MSDQSQNLGKKTIDGVKATGYGVTVSVRKLIQESKTERARSIYQTVSLDKGVTQFPAQIWLEHSGRIRELRWTTHPKFSPATSSTEVFSYSSSPVSISFPPAADVTPAGSLQDASTLAYRAAH